MKRDTKINRLRNLLKDLGVLHARDLASLGIPGRYLGRLCQEGLLTRTGRGLYIAAGVPQTAHLGLALAAKAIPNGVVCLLSALRFHEIGTQAPSEVWMAIDQRAARPRLTYPKARIIRFSGKALTEGVEENIIANVRVKIYTPAKTVVDCFKYRNKIGLDVALEAIREVRRKRQCTNDEIWKYAKICRMTEVMRPYLEAIQ